MGQHGKKKQTVGRGLTRGILVMPPTSSTSLMSVAATPASFMQSLQGCCVRFNRSPTKLSNLHSTRSRHELDEQCTWLVYAVASHLPTKLSNLHNVVGTRLTNRVCFGKSLTKVSRPHGMVASVSCMRFTKSNYRVTEETRHHT